MRTMISTSLILTNDGGFGGLRQVKESFSNDSEEEEKRKKLCPVDYGTGLLCVPEYAQSEDWFYGREGMGEGS